MKGLCIMLIVMHHTDADFFDMVAPNLDNALQSFRVPMYYFLSGLFFKTYGGFNVFLRKKVNNLVIPFLFFHILGFAVASITHYCLGNAAPFNWQAVFYPLRYRTWPYTLPLWFLMSLFEVNLIFFALRHYLHRWWLVLAVIAVGVVGYAISFRHIMLPFMLDTALVALPYFALGAMVRTVGGLNPSKADKWGWAIFVPVAVLIYLIAQHIDILDQEYPHIILLYLIPAAAILALLWMSKNLRRRIPVLCYWGQFSLIILGTHDLILTPLDHVVWPWALSPIGEILVKYAITMLLELPVIALLIRIAPQFTAQREFFGPGWRLKWHGSPK